MVLEALPQEEVVPSPQPKRYSTACPRLLDDPPVLKLILLPTLPVEGPVGAEGLDTVSDVCINVADIFLSPFMTIVVGLALPLK